MHAPIPTAFSLFFLPLSFFLSILFLFLISNYYLVVGCFSHLGLFPFGSPSLGAYYSLTMGFFLRCLRPLGSPSFSVFLSSPVFPLIPLRSFSVPSSYHVYFPFIVNTFNGISSFYPYGFTNCFWFVEGVLSRLPTHPLVVPAIAQYMSAATLLISRQNSLLFVPVVYLYL